MASKDGRTNRWPLARGVSASALLIAALVAGACGGGDDAKSGATPAITWSGVTSYSRDAKVANWTASPTGGGMHLEGRGEDGAVVHAIDVTAVAAANGKELRVTDANGHTFVAGVNGTSDAVPDDVKGAVLAAFYDAQFGVRGPATEAAPQGVRLHLSDLVVGDAGPIGANDAGGALVDAGAGPLLKCATTIQLLEELALRLLGAALCNDPTGSCLQPAMEGADPASLFGAPPHDPYDDPNGAAPECKAPPLAGGPSASQEAGATSTGDGGAATTGDDPPKTAAGWFTGGLKCEADGSLSAVRDGGKVAAVRNVTPQEVQLWPASGKVSLPRSNEDVAVVGTAVHKAQATPSAFSGCKQALDQLAQWTVNSVPQAYNGDPSVQGQTCKDHVYSNKTGDFYATDFGCSYPTLADGSDDKAHPYADPGDNCIPGCIQQLAGSGQICAGLSGRDCENKVGWFAADAQRFGCGTKITVSNPANGRAAVLMAIDYGPNCTVEDRVNHAALDMSRKAMDYLFGKGTEHGSIDKAQVRVAYADASAPLGPVNGTIGSSNPAPPQPSPTSTNGDCGTVVFPSGVELQTFPNPTLSATYKGRELSGYDIPTCFIDTQNLVNPKTGQKYDVHVKVSANFELYEFVRTEIEGGYGHHVVVTPQLVAAIEKFRENLGAGLTLGSCFRSPKHQVDTCLSSPLCGREYCPGVCAKNSRHLYGLGCDLDAAYFSKAQLACDSGFGFSFKEGDHLHVDLFHASPCVQGL